jgi:hypothetical protein
MIDRAKLQAHVDALRAKLRERGSPSLDQIRAMAHCEASGEKHLPACPDNILIAIARCEIALANDRAHLHSCPSCFEREMCTIVDCTVEPDLGDWHGIPFGAHCRCEQCGPSIPPPAPAHNELLVLGKILRGEFPSMADCANCDPAFLAELEGHGLAIKRKQAERVLDAFLEDIAAQANPYSCRFILPDGVPCQFLWGHDGDAHGCVVKARFYGRGFVGPWIEPWAYLGPQATTNAPERWRCRNCAWIGTREQCGDYRGLIQCPLCLNRGMVDQLRPADEPPRGLQLPDDIAVRLCRRTFAIKPMCQLPDQFETDLWIAVHDLGATIEGPYLDGVFGAVFTNDPRRDDELVEAIRQAISTVRARYEPAPSPPKSPRRKKANQ